MSLDIYIKKIETMEFLKKIGYSVLSFLGLGKTKIQEVESKIEQKIEQIEAKIKQGGGNEKAIEITTAVKQEVKNVAQKAEAVISKSEVKTSNVINKVEKITTESKETVRDIKSRSRKNPDTKVVDTNVKSESPTKRPNRRRPKNKHKQEGK